MKKLLLLAIVVLGLSAVSFGQAASASASASATITTAMELTKTVDLAFGNITTGTAAGTVELSTAGVASFPQSGSNGPTGYGVSGTRSAASFSVKGSPGASYSISAISGITVTSAASGSTPMAVNTFVTNTTPNGKLDDSGNGVILVGATLNVGANQKAGLYKNDTGFTVTVNYN